MINLNYQKPRKTLSAYLLLSFLCKKIHTFDFFAIQSPVKHAIFYENKLNDLKVVNYFRKSLILDDRLDSKIASGIAS